MEIFEYGRDPKIGFKPDDGAERWVAPRDLRPEALAGSEAAVGAFAEGRSSCSLSDKLILMPCSAGKLSSAAPAEDVYTGVMWQTLRAQMQVLPRLAILSGKHGFLCMDQVIDPYEQLMTESRAQELLSDLVGQAAAAQQAIGDGPLLKFFWSGAEPTDG